MNKNAQSALGIGIIMVSFVTIIVGVVLFQAIAQEAGSSTTTSAIVNVTTGATNDTTGYMTDYRSITDVSIINGTGGAVVPADNYTVTNNVIDPTTGGLSVRIVPAAGTNLYGSAWFITGTAQPTTYIADSAARSITGLIAIFFALAIAVVALTPTLRSGVLNMVGGI